MPSFPNEEKWGSGNSRKESKPIMWEVHDSELMNLSKFIGNRDTDKLWLKGTMTIFIFAFLGGGGNFYFLIRMFLCYLNGFQWEYITSLKMKQCPNHTSHGPMSWHPTGLIRNVGSPLRFIFRPLQGMGGIYQFSIYGIRYLYPQDL